MKLAALLDEENILVHMEAADYPQAVQMLADTLQPALGQIRSSQVVEQVMEIETELALPPGHGVRIPHLRHAGIQRLLMALGTSQQGIPITPGSPELVHLVFLILAPKTESSTMLQTMASVARLVHTPENRKALVSTTSPARLLRILEESGIEVKKAIIAADLMNPVPHSASSGMTLRELVQVLAVSREEGVPVVDEKGTLQGEVSTRRVIEIGLPKYMKMIENPKVLSDFQPFEAFYKKEDLMRVEDIMNYDVLKLAPETPVEIVAHEMLTKYSQRAYIVKDERLLGVIYRKDIIRKVLSL